MHHSVTRKQPNSRMCLVCGLKNPLGLRAGFFEIDNGELVGVFRPADGHQGYPGRLHGGMATTMLDETIGRAILTRHDQDVWGVTVSLSVRFRKPVPLGVDLRVVGRVTEEDKRFFRGTGEILLADGTVAVEAQGRYLKMALKSIADHEAGELEWQVVPQDHDPDGFDL